MVSFISRVQILKLIFCRNKIKVKHYLAGFYNHPFHCPNYNHKLLWDDAAHFVSKFLVVRAICWKGRGNEAENRARAGVGTHNGCLSYSKLIICFNVINLSRVYRHYIVYTLFSKTYLRWGFHFEPFKCLHHSHMNNTVNSFDVSIVQFILYLTYQIKITVVYLYYVLEYNISTIYEHTSL